MNTALSVIRFSNRAIGYGEACTAHYPGYFYEVIEVVSTGGMLEYDSFSRVNRLVGKDGIATVDSYHVPPYQAMIEDYIAGFRGDRESSVSESESVDLLDLAIRSLKTSELPGGGRRLKRLRMGAISFDHGHQYGWCGAHLQLPMVELVAVSEWVPDQVERVKSTLISPEGAMRKLDDPDQGPSRSMRTTTICWLAMT